MTCRKCDRHGITEPPRYDPDALSPFLDDFPAYARERVAYDGLSQEDDDDE